MMVTPLPSQSQGRRLPVSPVKNGVMKQQQQPKKPSKILLTEATEFPSGAKSPIKKHLKHAAMANWTSSNPASPSSAASTRSQTTKAPQIKQQPATTTTTTSPGTSGAKMATMRASIIQVMLGLLDQEQRTVEGTIPILQALATLPLENPSVRHECLQLLQRLHEASSSPSKPQQRNSSSATHDLRFDASSDIPTSEGDEDVMPPSFVYEYDAGDHLSSASYQRLEASDLATDAPIFKKDSGRAKSLSLHHCKEFLLACANEIHELEDENPNFDYAEETSSETPRHRRRSHDHRIRDQNDNSSSAVTMMHMLSSRNGSGKGRTGLLKWRSTEFDYISTAPSSASVATELEVGFDDDLQADQGSEFSEVVRRADYLSDFDDDLEFEPEREAVSGRHSMHQLNTSSSAKPREQLSLKHRVFSALKANGLQSRRNESRKKLAFQNLKTNLRQMQLKRATMEKLRVATVTSHVLRSPSAKAATDPATSLMMKTPADRNMTRMKVLLSQQVDLVVVILCAAFLHSMLS